MCAAQPRSRRTCILPWNCHAERSEGSAVAFQEADSNNRGALDPDFGPGIARTLTSHKKSDVLFVFRVGPEPSRSLAASLRPIIRSRHNPRSVILGRSHLDRVQPRRRIRRAERDQVAVPHISRRIQHAQFEPLVAEKRRVLAAALLGNLFGQFFLNAFTAITSALTMFKVRSSPLSIESCASSAADGEKLTLSTSTSDCPIFLIRSTGLVCLLPWSRFSLISSSTRRNCFGSSSSSVTP